jgi:DNA invertase Pin-like site-specific DNA recombinase
MLVGYAWDSGASHSLELQLKALSDAGCAKIFSQQKNGTSAGTRDAPRCALDFVRDGDTLVVTPLDRLALPPNYMHDIIVRLAGSGVGFHCLQQSRVIPDSNEEASPALRGAVAA